MEADGFGWKAWVRVQMRQAHKQAGSFRADRIRPVFQSGPLGVKCDT